MEKIKIKKFYWIFLAIILFCYIGLKLWQLHYPEAILELKSQQLKVQVAKTPAHLHKGLGGREGLGEYDGMIFLFGDYKRQGIVMRDMYFKIDIIWLKDGVVVDIAPNVKLELEVDEQNLKRYYPRTDANAVLELPAGWVDKNGLKIGDRLGVVE